MDSFLRILKYAVTRRIAYVVVAACAAFLTSQCAHADYDAPSKTGWTGQDGRFPSPDAACTDLFNFWAAQEDRANEQQAAPPYEQQSATLWSCRFNYTNAYGQQVDSKASVKQIYCDEGGELINQTTCRYSGIPPPTCQAGANNLGGAMYTGTCVNGCTHNYSMSIQLSNGSSGYALSTEDGSKCTVNSTATGSTPEQNCADQGKGYIAMNGVVACVGQGTAGSTSPVVKTNADGTKTVTNVTNNTTTTTTNNTTTTTSTSVVNGGAGGAGAGVQTTTTTTTTNPDGSKTTSVDAETKPMADYCKDNPKVQLCKEADKGAFTGSCSIGFTCDGDAAQCALAKKVHESRCEDLQGNAITDTGKSLLDGTLGLGGTDPISNPTLINLGTTLDDSAFLSHGCLPDMPFTVSGRLINLPLSKLCSGLQSAGLIVLGFAYLIGIRIVFANS